MMDLIYSSATLTLVAMAGSNSNAGLYGVSRPRTMQVAETIGDCVFFTVPPTVAAERNASVWASRAWTMQEEVLSKRSLFFTDTQAEFTCGGLKIPETLDTQTLPGWRSPLPELLDMLVPGAYQVSVSVIVVTLHSSNISSDKLGWQIKGGDSIRSSLKPGEADYLLTDVFWVVISDYTSRRMTNDDDSLNAMLGLLSVWQRTLLPSGCVWGLPLSVDARSLGWMHDRRVRPRRRPAFPSWTWAGWEGEVTIDGRILGDGDGKGLGLRDAVGDMSVQYVGDQGQQLMVDGWEVVLQIRTEPFSEVLVSDGSGEALGSATERNFLHNNTIASGLYTCLVVKRVSYRLVEGGPRFQRVFLVVLKRNGEVAERLTSMTVTTFAGGDFMRVSPARRRLILV